MPLLYFVRHGKAAAAWGESVDPGLDDLGRKQADVACQRLEGLPKMPIVSSPLKRCQETSDPLCRTWGQHARIEPGVAEIPSPTDNLSERGAWLKTIMSGTWNDCEDWVREWRDSVIDTVMKIETDTVVFSHFIAINVVVGHAMGDDRVIVFRPDNCSITKIEVAGDAVRVIERGHEAETEIR